MACPLSSTLFVGGAFAFDLFGEASEDVLGGVVVGGSACGGDVDGWDVVAWMWAADECAAGVAEPLHGCAAFGDAVSLSNLE